MTTAGRRRIVVATADTLGERMAGPAIRAWHMARVLAEEHDVQLVTTGSASRVGDGFVVRAIRDRDVREVLEWCDVLIFQGWFLAGRPTVSASDKALVADIYDPMHLEQLEQARDAGDEGRRMAVERTTAVLNEQLLRADFLLCASEKQRHLWLGQLAALGRINPRTYDEDRSMRSLITVVPFGTEEQPARRTGPGAKGVVPGIEQGDQLVLWGGGIYNWFDPISLIRAIDKLRHRWPRVRLLFLGLRHPNPEIPEMHMATEARRLSDQLGLTDRHVFFNEQWVPYDERQNFLLDADIGVSTHFDHVETAYSFRTRLLDYFWSGLPVVTTAGDALADTVEERRLGLTVPPEDPVAIEAALDRLLHDHLFADSCRSNAKAVAFELRWSQVLAPVMEFCRAPRRAPDLVDPILGLRLERARKAVAPELDRGWRYDLRLLGQHLRRGGPALVARRLRSRIKRLNAERHSA